MAPIKEIESKYTWTVDVEYDQGGRTNSTKGLRLGLPIILETFRDNNVKGLFFISTELIRDHRKEIEKIKKEGHELGSHGHFHMVYKDKWRREEDERLSRFWISSLGSDLDCHFRAPGFNFETSDYYSKRDNHVGLLKYCWLNSYIPQKPTFYLHPFDLVRGYDYPNLFCRLWYSWPERACKEFKKLVRLYKGEHTLI